MTCRHILSPSTENRDRGTKLVVYRDCDGLDDIVLVRTDQRLIEHHRRVSESQWLVTLVREGALTLQEPAVTLDLDELYAGIDALPMDEGEGDQELQSS